MNMRIQAKIVHRQASDGSQPICLINTIYAESIAINACLRTKFSSVRNKVNSRMPIYVSAQLTIQDSQSLGLGVILKSQLLANTGWDIH